MVGWTCRSIRFVYVSLKCQALQFFETTIFVLCQKIFIQRNFQKYLDNMTSKPSSSNANTNTKSNGKDTEPELQGKISCRIFFIIINVNYDIVNNIIFFYIQTWNLVCLLWKDQKAHHRNFGQITVSSISKNYILKRFLIKKNFFQFLE